MLRKFFRGLIAIIGRARGSPWAPFAARTIAIGCGLVVLAWIGSSAAGAPLFGTRSSPEPLIEAGLVEIASTESADAASPVASSPPIASGTAAETPPTPHGRASPTDPVYLNHAGADELRRLPGVGAKRAAAILALRQRIGHFTRVEDLLRVKGVGRTTLRKWRPLVRLDTPDAGAST